MSRYQDNKYPLQPPYEDQVVFYEGTKVSLNPQGIEKKAKICPICSYPIHIRIVSFPCSHYFCFECYNKSTYACGVCSSLNARTERIDDYAQFYSCDNSCYKYFRTQEELQQHKASHQLLHQ